MPDYAVSWCVDCRIRIRPLHLMRFDLTAHLHDLVSQIKVRFLQLLQSVGQIPKALCRTTVVLTVFIDLRGLD